ncbi:hypothetical protein E3P99_00496 [Wallemia hederae]|uniref:TAP42-like protein n=1 Tax=Wallemia hederae TaxID=1540922 RepID=A0A4T0FV87_9BASI|nr:hypothetical protein E3P99_00496 [Wallemia hederae]
METKEIFKNATNQFEHGDYKECLSKFELLALRISATTAQGHLTEKHEELSVNRLRYLLVLYLLPDSLYKSSFVDVDTRRINLDKCVSLYRQYIETLDTIGIEVDYDTSSTTTDPSLQRDLKIKQFKQQKNLHAQVLEYKELLSDDKSGIFDTIFISLNGSGDEDQDDDDDDDDILREYILRLLQYLASQAHSQVHSIEQELALLNNIPKEVKDSRTRNTTEATSSDSTWRLDTPIDPANLLDKHGRPTRPFTIMPRGTQTTRQQIAAGVFQPGHRLPTMTIDEYLQDEQERGNIIEGGGPASENQPTSKEQLQLDTENDGTVFAEEAQEKQRQDQENWARYTEEVEKGSGNKMANVG